MMVSNFSEAALKIAIAQLAQNVGWHAIGTNSFEILIDLCARYMKEIGKLSTCFANQYNRTQVNFDDLQLAFNHLGISLNDLEDYYTHVDAIPFVKGNLAKYPVKVQNVKRINYPDPNELKARAEYYEEWLPSIKLDTDQDNKLLNSKLNKDNELNDEQNLNGHQLSEEELDKRYLNSLKQQLGYESKINGYTSLSALVPNYIYLSEQGQALSYGGKEGRVPESRLPPLTQEDLERIEQEEQRRKQEIQKEKAFQPLKLKINNEKLIKKYLKEPKKGTDFSKELLRKAKKDKKLKPKMNLNKLSIKMSLNQNLNKEKFEDNDSLKQKQDLIETAEKLGLNDEIDQLKKLNKLKESKMKEKKIKILKEEDIEKQKKKRERQLKKQQLEARKQQMREERKLKREAREREKEEKRKARELKRLERQKEKQEKSIRKKNIKKNKQVQSKAEIDDDSNSDFSINSSLTSSVKNNTNNSSLNEYDEKEAANILVSLSEDKKDKKINKKSNKKQKPSNSKLLSPINSDEDSDLSDDEDDDIDDKSESESSELSSEEDEKPVKQNNSSSKNKNKFKIKSNDSKKDSKQQNNDKTSLDKVDTNKTNNEQPVKPFKSLAERKAMPPEIMNPIASTPTTSTPPTTTVTNKPINKKESKFKKRKLINDSLDNLFAPTFTIPSIKKKEKKSPPPLPKKLTNDYIESSSSEDEKALIKKKDKKKKDETLLPKLTVKLPTSRTNSPLPISPKTQSNNLLTKKDKLNKKEDKKSKKDLLSDKTNKKDNPDKLIKKPEIKLSGSGKFSKSNSSNSNNNNVLNKTNNDQQQIENRPKKKAKVIITPTKAARKEAAEKGCVLVTQTVSTNDTDDREWICPSCSKPDDGSPMIGCDNCNFWFHWSCLGITQDPDEDSWFCSACINKQQQIEMKFKKKRKPDEEVTISHSNNTSNKANKIESNTVKDSKVHDNKNIEKEHKKPHKKEVVRVNLEASTSSKNLDSDIWICPSCKKPDDGSPMIGCDRCDKWYHYPCAGITVEPKDEEKWFCTRCIKTESLGHKHKKQKKN